METPPVTLLQTQEHSGMHREQRQEHIENTSGGEGGGTTRPVGGHGEWIMTEAVLWQTQTWKMAPFVSV